jgi:hypothetical protein
MCVLNGGVEEINNNDFVNGWVMSRTDRGRLNPAGNVPGRSSASPRSKRRSPPAQAGMCCRCSVSAPTTARVGM